MKIDYELSFWDKSKDLVDGLFEINVYLLGLLDRDQVGHFHEMIFGLLSLAPKKVEIGSVASVDIVR